ncbi:MAG TPA: TolC family protein [Burkholderiales bacterium]|nr:TolC family protein [Burkholderiales bacterium]
MPAFTAAGYTRRTMRARASILRRLFAGLVIAGHVFALLAACSLQRYQPAPLDPAASARAFEARSTDSPGLKQYMLAHGHPDSDWPVQRWGLADLTLLAFYYRPDLELARAQASAARARAAAAAQRAPIGLKPVMWHHSLQPPETTGPWSLGFEVEIPLGEESRRQAIREQYDALAEAAELGVGSVAWAARSEVRARFLDCYAAARTLELLDAEARERRSLVTLLERRFEMGAGSAVELGGARLKLAEVEGQTQSAQLAREQSLSGLARALGLPLTAVRTMSFDYAALELSPAPPNDRDVQRAALLNRLDVRAKLLEYAAADAAVKLEIARQYPTVTLSPGYLWDQGDNIWSLVATVLVPVAGNKPAIEAAQAGRQAAAREFLAMQGRVISDADGAQARYQKAQEGVASAKRVIDFQSARDQKAKKQFDAGYTDRVELTLSHLEALTVERNALSVGLETQRALGALEDALQVPLAGAPEPSWAREKAQAGSSSPGLARQ